LLHCARRRGNPRVRTAKLLSPVHWGTPWPAGGLYLEPRGGSGAFHGGPGRLWKDSAFSDWACLPCRSGRLGGGPAERAACRKAAGAGPFPGRRKIWGPSLDPLVPPPARALTRTRALELPAPPVRRGNWPDWGRRPRNSRQEISGASVREERRIPGARPSVRRRRKNLGCDWGKKQVAVLLL